MARKVRACALLGVVKLEGLGEEAAEDDLGGFATVGAQRFRQVHFGCQHVNVRIAVDQLPPACNHDGEFEATKMK